MLPLMPDDFQEQIAKYKFSEDFDNVNKTVEFSTNSLVDVFTRMMDFLIYCGVDKEMLYDMFDEYKDGFI